MTFRSGVLLMLLATNPLASSGAAGQTRSPEFHAFRSEGALRNYLRQIIRERGRGVGQCMSLVRIARRTRVPAADSGAAIVAGRVTSPGGPVSAFRVSALELGIAASGQPDGSYRLRVPPDSLKRRRTVMLQVTALGYSAERGAIRLATGEQLEVNFGLCAEPLALQEVVVTATTSTESITNVQHQGVDEGGIVKLHGDHLVILLRGRLFTVRVGDDLLHPVAMVNAYAPGIDARADWYDEMVVHGDRVYVIGYSYRRGTTEIGVFDIDRHGGLRHRSTWQLRSNDYYSSRNYTSRVVGTRLVLYSLLALRDVGDPLDALPTMRRWSPDRDGGFERIVTPRRVYRAPGLSPLWSAVHTITSCDLASDEFRCEAEALIGPWSRVFYVSERAVYLWMSEAWWLHRPVPGQSSVIRFPLDGSRPGALAVRGSPVDQYSFLEGDDGFLNVLVLDHGLGDGMWAAERSSGSAALLRVPVSSFGQAGDPIPDSRYRLLPAPGQRVLHNRFVPDHLLYGAGSGWGSPQAGQSTLHVVPLGGGSVTSLQLPHGADRIEAMGSGAVVVGTDPHNLHVSGIRLGDRPQVVQHHMVPNAAQGELRSHGFFYRTDGPESGILGLPIRAGGQPGWRHLFDASAAVMFLTNDGSRFEPLGFLQAGSALQAPDGCVASCVDWYGNTRPLFFGGRIMALMGYELVEGRLSEGRIQEVGRINFAPPNMAVRR